MPNVVSVTREAIFNALFNTINTLHPTTFTTVTRRMVMPADIVDDAKNQVAAELLPMLILWEKDQITRYDMHALPITEYQADLIIYFSNPHIATTNVGNNITQPSGSTTLNPLLDAVYALFQPDNLASGRFTIGGLVSWCRIEGRTFIENGDSDPAGIGGAQIPVSVMVGQ